MENKVDKQRIKFLRKQKAWSQHHLSTLCNVSLKTIQRIEKTGVTSYETLQAISSVFELQPSDLQIIEKEIGRSKTPILAKHFNFLKRKKFVLKGILIGAICCFSIGFILIMAQNTPIHNHPQNTVKTPSAIDEVIIYSDTFSMLPDKVINYKGNVQIVFNDHVEAEILSNEYLISEGKEIYRGDVVVKLGSTKITTDYLEVNRFSGQVIISTDSLMSTAI
uniref:helix-turn-helix domain-containing protein n=1 Tax=Ningiella ruwaisensis TaxID=2364274 RepID=UPI00109F296A|nr:helix-turn-helix transcriptional regulator [Ningiella ruwaisensis]